MVYCTKCGTENEEGAEVCVKCGAPLVAYSPSGRERMRWRQERMRQEEECFGLPHGGAIVGLVIGVIIILVGLASLSGIEFGRYLWPLIIIVFGILIVAGALYRYSRR